MNKISDAHDDHSSGHSAFTGTHNSFVNDNTTSASAPKSLSKNTHDNGVPASAQKSEQRPTILLLDDNPTNLKILSTLLAPDGYRLLYAFNGENALNIARLEQPDLALFDILMPGIDGYETCRRLKSDPVTRNIPVLFLSTLDKVEDKVTGFDVGGLDYISKPFQKDELLARVHTHIELSRMRNENLRYAQEMEQRAEKLARSLVHADRLATLGTISAGIAHEINNPTAFISIAIQTIERLWRGADAVCAQSIDSLPEEKARHLKFTLENVPTMIGNIRSGVSRIQTIVSGLKTYARQGISAKDPCSINKCIQDALNLCHSRLKHKVTISTNLCEDEPLVLADDQQIVQVFVNLLLNAADALESRPTRSIQVQTRHTSESFIAEVVDNGPGIPPESIDRIWDPFFTTKSRDKGTGLGLSISKGIIEDHGGQITVENRPEGGACFLIMLPIKELV